MSQTRTPRKKYQHWTVEEYSVIEFFRNRGDSWASIQARLPHRSVADLRVYWSTHRPR